MSTDHHIRVVISVEPGESPIRGLIEREGGREEEFFGWLRLMVALEEISTGSHTSAD